MKNFKAYLFLFFLVSILSSCHKNQSHSDFFYTVLNELERIESASYWSKIEYWNPVDTIASYEAHQYVESYRNSSDTTIGSSWAIFNSPEKDHLNFAYDGNMRTLIYDDVKGIVLDSFNVRKLPFRPVAPPFYNYAENILKYILNNQDSTSLVLNDSGEEFYVKLTIHEERQVEFFGKAHLMPESPYVFDPTSIYELWINKKDKLPTKVRREMSHSISVSSISDVHFNQLKLSEFKADDYFPNDYEIRPYGIRAGNGKINGLIGTQAPEWTLENTNEEYTALDKLNGKVVMLQFTSVSCGPCKASIPFLNNLTEDYDASEFELIAIECTSFNNHVLDAYIKRNRINYTLLKSTKEIKKDYAIKAFPMFIILDKERKIKHIIRGYGGSKTENQIRESIRALI